MEAACSTETSVPLRLHGVTSPKVSQYLESRAIKELNTGGGGLSKRRGRHDIILKLAWNYKTRRKKAQEVSSADEEFVYITTNFLMKAEIAALGMCLYVCVLADVEGHTQALNQKIFVPSGVSRSLTDQGRQLLENSEKIF
jgi:hypothetical protein